MSGEQTAPHSNGNCGARTLQGRNPGKARRTLSDEDFAHKMTNACPAGSRGTADTSRILGQRRFHFLRSAGKLMGQFMGFSGQNWSGRYTAKLMTPLVRCGMEKPNAADAKARQAENQHMASCCTRATAVLAGSIGLARNEAMFSLGYDRRPSLK